MFKGRSFLVKMVKDDESGNAEEVDLTKEVKNHFERNKSAYISGLGCLGMVFLMTRGRHVVAPNVPAGQNVVTVRPLSLLSNRVTTSVVTVIEREGRGHPGYIVKCIETGELFTSQKRAALAQGVSDSTFSQHLNGLRPHVGGLHFERVGETL
jgi:hypothetical protein